MTVPYQHLVDQWDKASQQFGYRPILACQSKSSWFDNLNSMIMDFSSGYRECFCVITTHTTLMPSQIVIPEAFLIGNLVVTA